jgi:phosphopantothenoylcysteine decarboxylase
VCSPTALHFLLLILLLLPLLLPMDRRRVLVCCTGSVASVKVPLIVSRLLASAAVDVRVVTTQHALHFFKPDEVAPATLYTDADEWSVCE